MPGDEAGQVAGVTPGDAGRLGPILLATLASGLVSVLLAAALARPLLGRLVRQMVSLSVGVLLGTALLHMLPEAFERAGASIESLFTALLGGLLFFFLLEKAELYRHGHHHEGDGHHHHEQFDAQQAGRGGTAVLVGDSIHNFCDGLIIAAAFLADTSLGWMTALAIAAHEIPQELGDFIVLLNAGFSRRRALVVNVVSGLAAVAGGVLGWLLLGRWDGVFPYLLVIAASSMIYVAVADLVPQLQRRLGWQENAQQIAWLVAGLALAVAARAAAH